MYESEDLAIPDGPTYKAKSAVMNLLQTDPVLASVVRSWLFYEGEDVSDSDPDTIPRPFLRLTCKPGLSGWFSEGQFRLPMVAALELGVDGLRDRNIMNLWDQVRTALAPNFTSPDGVYTNLYHMQKGGISQLSFDECPYAIVNQGTGNVRYLYARGEITFQLLVTV